MQNENLIQNYEQIRAKHAYDDKDSICVGKEGGRAGAKKFPAMIVSNGFVGALAFAAESGEGLATVAFSVVDHLERGGFLPREQTFGMKSTIDGLKSVLDKRKAISKEEFKRSLSTIINNGIQNLDSFIGWLASEPANTLRILTAESLAYLNYLRRFASPGDEP